MLNRPCEQTLKNMLSSNPSIPEATYSCLDYPPESLFWRKALMRGHKCLEWDRRQLSYGHDYVLKLTQMLLMNSYNIKCSEFPPIHPISLCPLRQSRSWFYQLYFQVQTLSSHRPVLHKGTSPALSTPAWRRAILEGHQHGALPELYPL